jgi:hypothetical protein
MAAGGCDTESERERLREALRDVAPEFDHGEFVEESLTAAPLFEGEQLGLPLTATVLGDRVYVGDATLAPGIHVLSRHDGRYLGGLGSRGEGPGEFGTFPRFLRAIDASMPPLLAFDPALGRFTEIPIDLSANPEALRNARFEVGFTLLDLARRSDSTFVGWGVSPGSRLVILAGDGTVVDGIGEVPQPASLRALHVGLRQRAYQASVAVSPDGSKVAAATWRGSRVDTYVESPDGNRHRFTEGPFPFLPDVHIDETLRTNQLVWGPENRAGHVGVVATNTAVLTLFSGRLEYAFRGAMDEGAYVHVYDWSGNFLRAFHLDRPSRGITCENTYCNSILTVAWTPVPAVLRYRLPEGWDQP